MSYVLVIIYEIKKIQIKIGNMTTDSAKMHILCLLAKNVYTIGVGESVFF